MWDGLRFLSEFIITMDLVFDLELEASVLDSILDCHTRTTALFRMIISMARHLGVIGCLTVVLGIFITGQQSSTTTVRLGTDRSSTTVLPDGWALHLASLELGALPFGTFLSGIREVFCLTTCSGVDRISWLIVRDFRHALRAAGSIIAARHCVPLRRRRTLALRVPLLWERNPVGETELPTRLKRRSQIEQEVAPIPRYPAEVLNQSVRIREFFELLQHREELQSRRCSGGSANHPPLAPVLLELRETEFHRDRLRLLQVLQSLLPQAALRFCGAIQIQR